MKAWWWTKNLGLRLRCLITFANPECDVLETIMRCASCAIAPLRLLECSHASALTDNVEATAPYAASHALQPESSSRMFMRGLVGLLWIHRSAHVVRLALGRSSSVLQPCRGLISFTPTTDVRYASVGCQFLGEVMERMRSSSCRTTF